MAGEGEVTVKPGELLGPDDEGSLSHILAHAPKLQYDGEHLSEVAEGKSPEEVAAEAAAAEEVAAAAQREVDEAKAKEEAAQKEADEAAKAAAAEPPKFKYGSHEEAEEGAKAHQRMATEKAEEAKRERETREAAEKRAETAVQEAEAARQELAEIKAKEKEAEVEAAKPATKAEQKTRVKNALRAIREIDEDDPDYEDKIAEAWMDAGVGTPGVPMPDPKEIAKEAAKLTREELKAEKVAEDQKTEEQRRKDEALRTREDANGMATKAGLNMAEGSADFRLFWNVAPERPEELKGKPLQEQVDWAVNEVRRLKGDVVQTTEAERERTRKVQANNAVLERGSARPKAPEKPEEYSLNSIVQKTVEQRKTRRP